MKTKTVTGLAYWASAIINLDYSGMKQEDKTELNNWLASNSLSFSDCLTCSDAYIGRFDGQVADVCDYTFTDN